MIVAAIDPSSTCAGVAIAELDAGAFTIIDAFAIRPRASLPPLERIKTIANRLHTDVIARHHPQICVIEITSGKVNRQRHGGGAGLGVYGMAVGYLIRSLESSGCDAGARIVPVEENLWTGGHSKEKRRRVAARLFPAYDPNKDRTADLADAICLAYWHSRRNALSTEPSSDGENSITVAPSSN